MLSPVEPHLQKQDLETFFSGVSVQCGASRPSEIQLVSALEVAYIVYSSVDSAKKVLLRLGGVVNISGTPMSLDYYQLNLKKANLGSESKVTSLQDWICNKCEYKNYAKRPKCHKCETPRTDNCRIVYNTPIVPKSFNPSSHMAARSMMDNTIRQSQFESLVINGEGLKISNEKAVREYFQAYASLRQVTLSINQRTGVCQGFGLLEFFHPEDAEYLHRVITASDFRFNGYPMSAVLSKLNRDSFHSQYKVNEKIESQNEGAKSHEIAGFKLAEPKPVKVTHFVQQSIEIQPPAPVSKDTTQEQLQKYYDDYYKNVFAQLAQMGLYYDRATNTYKPLIEPGGEEPNTDSNDPYGQKSASEVGLNKLQITGSEARNQAQVASKLRPGNSMRHEVDPGELEMPLPLPEEDFETAEPPVPIVPKITSKCDLCKRGFFTSQSHELHKKMDSRHKELVRRQLLQQLGLAK